MLTALDEELPVVVFQKSLEASLAAASLRVDTALLILPTSEICVWIFDPALCRLVSGCFSMAISCVMIELASIPLPTPSELMVAMGSAFQEMTKAPAPDPRGALDALLSAAAART